MDANPNTITLPTLPLKGALEAAERQIIAYALDLHGTQGDAADALGITRHAFKRRLVKYEVPHNGRRGGLRRPAKA